MLEKHKIVCPNCEGTGRTTNPAIDGNGLPDECVQDQDFMEDYLSGVYDVRCVMCHGNNVIDEVIEDWGNPEFIQYTEDQEEERQYQAMCAAERAMGA